MDPLSIAGLTIAVFDQSLKIGNHTAELVSNLRNFDNDTKGLGHKICDENNRTRALRMLLFESSNVRGKKDTPYSVENRSFYSRLHGQVPQPTGLTYNGRCLFEQFDTDVQDQIHIFLEEATGVLAQVHHLLECRQEPVFSKEPKALSTLTSSHSGNLTSTSIESSISTLKRLSSFQRLRWSFHDKKRVETIVRDFSELNGRIHESIKLWCLGTSIGVDLQHLKHLENDVNSRTLGFDIDARLQIATREAQVVPAMLEMTDGTVLGSLDHVKNFGNSFGVMKWQETTMLVEYRSYAPESPIPVDLDDRTRDLVERLANLLHQPKEIVFRTPCCKGWARQMQHNRVAYMFAIPDDVDPTPVSLLELLPAGDRAGERGPPPSLSQKFQLAAKLSRCISQLQLVKWVHESFRSENILFFPRMSDKGEDTQKDSRLDFSEPWVHGFEFSRPETYFSHGHADVCLSRDIYRHPDRQRHPSQPFNKMHDIYALGVVLLEIGLWQAALSLDKSGFSRVQEPQAIKKHLLKHAEKRLGSKMGEKYQEVVLTCLRGSFEVSNDTKEDLKLQQLFRSQVVDVLQKAADNV